MLTRELLQNTINHMPDEFTFDEILDEILLIEKIEVGLKQAEIGETVTEDELDLMVDSWQK